MEVVSGIDNLIFISILPNKLPVAQRQRARRIGIVLALVRRLALLTMVAWIAGLVAPVFDRCLIGAPGPHGEPGFETVFSWRDLIPIADGFGGHVPKGCIYTAMAFSAGVEMLDISARRRRGKKEEGNSL